MQILRNILIFGVALVISFPVLAGLDCRVTKLLSDPRLAENVNFWEDFGKITHPTDRAMLELMKKYVPDIDKVKDVATHANSAAVGIDLAHKADKAYGKLTQINKDHFDEFLKIVKDKGTHGLYEQPGKWHYEKIERKGKVFHTVRLDQGVRVQFVESNGSVLVEDIGNHITH